MNILLFIRGAEDCISGDSLPAPAFFGTASCDCKFIISLPLASSLIAPNRTLSLSGLALTGDASIVSSMPLFGAKVAFDDGAAEVTEASSPWNEIDFFMFSRLPHVFFRNDDRFVFDPLRVLPADAISGEGESSMIGLVMVIVYEGGNRSKRSSIRLSVYRLSSCFLQTRELLRETDK